MGVEHLIFWLSQPMSSRLDLRVLVVVLVLREYWTTVLRLVSWSSPVTLFLCTTFIQYFSPYMLTLEMTLCWQAIYILHPTLRLRVTVFALQLLVEPEVGHLQLASNLFFPFLIISLKLVLLDFKTPECSFKFAEGKTKTGALNVLLVCSPNSGSDFTN